MNIALEKTEEFVNSKLRRSYGDAFVRGNNGMLHLSKDSLSSFSFFLFLTGALVLYISAS